MFDKNLNAHVYYNIMQKKYAGNVSKYSGIFQGYFVDYGGSCSLHKKSLRLLK